MWRRCGFEYESMKNKLSQLQETLLYSIAYRTSEVNSELCGQKIPSAGAAGTIGGSAIQHARGGMRRG